MSEGSTHMAMRHKIRDILEKYGYVRKNYTKGYFTEHIDQGGVPKPDGDGLSLYYGKKSEVTRMSNPDIFIVKNDRLKGIIEIEDKDGGKKYLIGDITTALMAEEYAIKQRTIHIESNDVVFFLVLIKGAVLEHMQQLTDEALYPAFRPKTHVKKVVIGTVDDFEGQFVKEIVQLG